MFKTKLEVDKHVDNSLKKINNETERNLRSFSFAKLYFNVGDYEHAVRYASLYLSVKPKSAEGQQLLGKAFEKLGKKDSALEAYRKSLQLDPKQNNLVFKVCELLASDDVDMDKAGARYFCDLAQSFDPHNSAVFNLKERLITMENKDPDNVSKLLLDELENRPTDVNLRVRLLKHFLQNNMVKEAYKHAADVDAKDLAIFHNSISWYETFAEVLVRYQRDLANCASLTWEFWFLSVSVLDRLVALSLDDHVDNVKSTSDFVNILFTFDQNLAKASQIVSSCPERQLSLLFLNHYHAQLYFHIATCLFKQAKKDVMPFKEVSNLTLPVLFAAYHSQPPDIHSVWLNSCPENRRRMVNKWYKQAAYRCSQIGHVLLGAMKDRKSILLEKAEQYSTGMWREQLYKKLFVKRDQQQKMNTSFFVTSTNLLEPVLKMPETADLLQYDEVAQTVYPDSLHHHIWIALNNQLPNYILKCFDGLSYSVKQLNNCSAESLSVLDIQAFIYCATISAKAKLDESKNLIYYNNDKPNVLPAAITEPLGTLKQSKFLAAAYKMYRNEQSFNTGEIRQLLIKGIEVVRCVGHHGLDVKMLVKLANIFEERSKNTTKQSEIEANDARAELYWKSALPLLEKLKNNQVVTYPSNRLFELNTKEFTMSEATINLDKGKLFTAVQLMKKKEHEKALQIFETLKDPYASYYQSQIYKLLGDQKTNQNKENVTSEMRSQNIILLSKARDCLYLTLDRLREPSVDRSHPLNTQLGSDIEKIERLLSRVDPDCTNRNECDGMSDENVSTDSAGEHYLTSYSVHQTSYQHAPPFTPKHDVHNNHSTPYRMDLSRREARPSPERLDAQLRQLVASKDAALNNIVEQNKMMVESHRSLLDELRSFKDAVNNLTATVEDLKGMRQSMEELKVIKTSVKELKDSVDDLQNVVDVVREMKRDITELKKDSLSKAAAVAAAQLSEEDLYDLDPQYGGVDYPGLGQYNQAAAAAVYHPNYAQGPLSASAGALNAAAAAAAQYGGPAALYPSLYSMAAYAYGNNVLPQPGSLPYVQDQQIPGYPAQTAMAPSAQLPQSNLNISLLTGQGLSQSLPQPTNLVKETPKATLSTFTNTTQTVFPAMSPVTVSKPSVIQPPVSNKAAPVNVVITSSDPLPTHVTPVSQPILSVTIPPQHIKGSPQSKTQPHNYQIPLPSTGNATVTTTPSILSKPPPVVSTQSILSNVAPPVFSAVSPAKTTSMNVSLGLQIEKTLDKTFSPNVSLNKSNASTASADEHDPCPDFKPIIPLPDEVPVTTGEEDENVLFCERAKLFRHVNKEWKERGVGNIKILQHKQSGKIRILMRRDQVHKICANHYLSKDMTMSPMANNDRAYIWAAQDYSDGEMTVEKFCVRFKTSEEAKKFSDAFEDAKKKIVDKPTTSVATSVAVSTPFSVKKTEALVTPQSKPSFSSPNLGGFVFSGTPTFKPKEDPPVEKPVAVTTSETVKPSPFSNFSFGSTSKTTISGNLFGNLKSDFASPTTSSTSTFSPVVLSSTPSQNTLSSSQKDDDDQVEEFVPTAEFTPVLSVLPDLVDVKTGEENAEVLFECKSKLFKLATTDGVKEWKERGVGILKILKEDGVIRLLMRRDQVHKVCLNHTVLKDMVFKLNEQNKKAVFWAAKDFSEGELIQETFTARFKTEEQAREFLQILQSNQATLNEQNTVSNKHHKPSTAQKSPLGEKFKQAKGTWECKNCYIFNDAKENRCVACETPKNPVAPKKEDSGQSGALFSFGVPTAKDVKPESAPGSFLFGSSKTTTATTSWGDSFKPAEGSWECKSCFVRNDAAKTKCSCCEALKDGTAPPANKGVNLETPGLKFNFGVSPAVKPAETTPKVATPKEKVENAFSFGSTPVSSKTDVNKAVQPATKGFGDAFKPKANSWECQGCFVRNDGNALYCVSCESPKDDTVPKKESTNKGVNLETPGLKFSFGVSQTPPATAPAPAAASDKTAAAFSFGNAPSPAFSFGKSTTSATTTNLFGSSPKSTFTFTPVSSGGDTVKAPAKFGSAQDKKPETGQFVFGSPTKHEFEFTPRSPRKVSQGQGDDESDGSYVEEEADNIYFKPVIPLPDKVEVVTGEEEEDVLYCQRAKLFRFTNSEWKERGLGDLKILKRKDTGKLRVLMRREQVMKICLNHVLNKDIEYRPKDEKTWLFHAADYSEGELSRDQFCLRFKTAEVAIEFKKAVDDAVGGSASAPVAAAAPSVPESEDDVILLDDPIPAEEIAEAKRLKLPLTFFNFRSKPDCKCDQCIKDDEYYRGTELSTLPAAPKADTAKKPESKPTNQSGGLFGSPVMPTTQSLFGSPSFISTTTSGIFSTLAQKNQQQPVATTAADSPSLKTLLTTPSTLSKTGNMFATPPSTTTNIFGNKSLFGGPTPTNFGTTASVTPVFGGTPTNKPIFGAAATPPLFGNTTAAQPIFGNTSAAQPIFGSTTAAQSTFSSTTAAQPTFGSTTAAQPIFGGTAAAKPVFGGLSAPKPLFGSATSATPVFGATTTSANTSIFSSNNSSPFTSNIFGSATTTPANTPTSQKSGGSIFGGSAFGSSTSVFPSTTSSLSNIFSAPAQAETTKLKEGDELVLKCKSDVSFATLAANVSGDAPPAFSKKDDEKTPFSFLGAGAPVFGSSTMKKIEKNLNVSKSDEQPENSVNEEQDEDGDATGNAEEEYDPHYEPIIPMPDAIVVSTGEENEEIKFNERAKVYRFVAETKEWKERGVGQLKILFHPENLTYRLILRREQVHKVVLNQLIQSDLEVQPMMSSDKAWMWAGHNFTDDGQQFEKLAVRFKTSEMAEQFKQAIDLSICKVIEINNKKLSEKPVQQEIPTTVTEFDPRAAGERGEGQYEYDEEDDDDEDDDDDDDEDLITSAVYECEYNNLQLCTQNDNGQWTDVGTGTVGVYYYNDLYVARINFTDTDGVFRSSTTIGSNTLMELNGCECIWKAVERVDEKNPQWKTFKIKFPNEVAAKQFHTSYLEGVNYAQEVGVEDDIENDYED